MKLQLTGEMEMDLSSFVKKANDWIDECNIDTDQLTHQMCEQPGMFAYYGAIAAYATNKLARAKSELKSLEAEVHKEIRDRYRKAGEKIAIKIIEMEVDEDSRVQGMREEVRGIKLETDLCKVASESFSHRTKMLISVGAQERSEIGGLNPSIRQIEAEQEKKLRELTSHTRKLSEIHKEKLQLRRGMQQEGSEGSTEMTQDDSGSYQQTRLPTVGKPRS